MDLAGITAESRVSPRRGHGNSPMEALDGPEAHDAEPKQAAKNRRDEINNILFARAGHEPPFSRRNRAILKIGSGFKDRWVHMTCTLYDQTECCYWRQAQLRIFSPRFALQPLGNIPKPWKMRRTVLSLIARLRSRNGLAMNPVNEPMAVINDALAGASVIVSDQCLEVLQHSLNSGTLSNNSRTLRTFGERLIENHSPHQNQPSRGIEPVIVAQQHFHEVHKIRGNDWASAIRRPNHHDRRCGGI